MAYDAAALDRQTANGAAAARRAAEERRVTAWVGKSVVFKGTLTSSEDMTIDGRVEGSIQINDNTLTIGPDANIQADIVARGVTIFGAVSGKITATDKVEICDGASVEGNIKTARLAMADGGWLKGRVERES
jgi:cytoskeletal protein CcmA (bactofilin family)